MSEPEQKSVDPLAADDPFADAALVDDPVADAAAPAEAAAPLQQQPVQPRTQKPRSNVYTMMLILSFAAIVTACVVLYLHLDRYGTYPWWEVPSDISSEVGA